MAAALPPLQPLPAPLHPADLIALESMAWASLLPTEPSPCGLRVYQQASAEGIASQVHAHPFALPPGHRTYRTSSW